METTFDIISQSVKKSVKKVKRTLYLKRAIGIGNIKEECDKVICYVRKGDVLRFREESFSNSFESRKYFYDIKLDGLTRENEISDEAKSNKPVYYIFDGIDFLDNVEIHLKGSNVVFKNCTFAKNITVHSLSKVTFKDCVFKYPIAILGAADVKFEHNNYKPCRLANESFLDVHNSKKISFINDSFTCGSDTSSTELYRGYNSHFGFQINSEEVDIIDSKIDINYIESNISAKKILIKKSLINVEDIRIKADNLKMDDSLIVGENRIVLDLNQRELACTIKAPVVFCNGMRLQSKLQEPNVVEESLQIEAERNRLVECLKLINSWRQQLEEERNKNANTILRKVKVK